MLFLHDYSESKRKSFRKQFWQVLAVLAILNPRRKKEGCYKYDVALCLCVCLCLWHRTSQTDGPILMHFFKFDNQFPCGSFGLRTFISQNNTTLFACMRT